LKICYDTLEKVKYIKRTGNFRINKHTYYYFDECLSCGDSYIGAKTHKCCTVKCAKKTEKWKQKQYESHKDFKHTEKIRQKISIGNTGNIHTEETKRLLSKLNSGDKNPMFGNGHKIKSNKNGSYIDGRWCDKNDPYCIVWSDKEWKDYLKQTRDKGKCWCPYCNGKHLHKLTLHHINYIKKNCNGENLITLCCSCNSKANHDREWHELYYITLMIKRGYA
jgi:hypothetical protein